MLISVRHVILRLPGNSELISKGVESCCITGEDVDIRPPKWLDEGVVYMMLMRSYASGKRLQSRRAFKAPKATHTQHIYPPVLSYPRVPELSLFTHSHTIAGTQKDHERQIKSATQHASIEELS